MHFTLFIWRQTDRSAQGSFERHEVADITHDMSFLDMLDALNERLVKNGVAPVAFDSDCREGICGMCGQTVNGVPHGPRAGTTLCQLSMRHFSDGDTLYIEPFRAGAFPIIRDLMVDRSALDSLMLAGGYISARTGGAPDANSILISKRQAANAMDSAVCIGCGACVAACPNGSAMLFGSAKVAHLAALPQGMLEAEQRVSAMSNEMSRLGFGACGNHYECEAACPKGIKAHCIAKMNREYLKALLRGNG